MRALLHGTPDDIRDALCAAGFTLAVAPPAVLLVNQLADADAAIANAKFFADALPPDQEALVVNILHPDTPGDWPSARAAALLWAHTRHAARAWAPRRIRVNAIGPGVSPIVPGQPALSSGQAAGPAPAAPATPADIAATILAMWEFRSMTGQLIRLGAQPGTP
jgi:hypothetical protein